MRTGLWPRVDRRGGEELARDAEEVASIGVMILDASGSFARTSSIAVRNWALVAVSMYCLSWSICEVSRFESVVRSITPLIDSAILFVVPRRV